MLIKSTVAPGAALYYVISEAPPASKDARALVERLLASDAPAGYEVHITGETAYSYDFFNELSTWFPWVFAWVVVITMVVFLLLLRSVLLPVVAVVVNLFTIAMSYGILVLLFQGDRFEKILRFTSTGGIDIIIPVVLLCILFGITMDYAVFMLTRMHERWNRSGDCRERGHRGGPHRQNHCKRRPPRGHRDRSVRLHKHRRNEDARSRDRLSHHCGHLAHPPHVAACSHDILGQSQLVVPDIHLDETPRDDQGEGRNAGPQTTTQYRQKLHRDRVAAPA